MYDRWLDWKATAELDREPCIEVRAEDLVADWPAQRKALFGRLGVDNFETASAFRSESLDHRADQFDSTTHDMVVNALAGTIPGMGYE